MADYITVPSALNDTVGRTAVSVEVVSVIALIVDQQPVSAYLVALSVVIQSIACDLVACFALLVAQKVGIFTEEDF